MAQVDLKEQLNQLEAARNLVLSDAALYPQVLQGILPIIGINARLDLRRWGADFLAETFANTTLPSDRKESLSGTVLPTLNEYLGNEAEDVAVVKSAVQTVSSLYPFVFRHIIHHPDDKAMWEQITSIKHNILQRMDSAPHPVRVCCIKFVQKVVHTQTPGPIADPRRPERNETSIAIVPRTHSLLSIPNLEAEASGLLDRLLTVLQDNADDAILVNATINCLGILIRTRPTIANKILETLLNFNPVKVDHGPMTSTMRVKIKSMERTTRAVLINLLKRNPNHPLAGKMHQHMERLAQNCIEAFDASSRKRALPDEPTDGLDNAKRARLGAETPPLLKIPPLPEGPISYSQLYTLTEDIGLSSFDVKQLPPDLIVKIAVAVLGRVDQNALTQATDAIRGRYQTLIARQAQQAQAPAEEDEDEYEPEYQPVDIPESEVQDTTAAIFEVEPELGPFQLSRPPPLTGNEANEIGRAAADRVFEMMIATPFKAAAKPVTAGGAAASSASTSASASSSDRKGFARLAGGSLDSKEAWITMLVRMATRAPAKLEAAAGEIQTSDGRPTISNYIRDLLYRHILEDFRSRINIGIMWLNEEWYNDRMQMEAAASQRGKSEEVSVPLHYDSWVLRLLGGILPYLDARDVKILIRFLSEIPEVTLPIIGRVQTLARDPERINLCVQALHYLVMFRPPAREMCLNTLEEIYNTYEEARPAASRVLSRWRPEAISSQQTREVSVTGSTTNGVQQQVARA
ncbi:mRNA cleavage and polyadenylation specificity factor complex subunit (Pta1), putative [Talaromyces stipitatus ATCC 10500]|uniref:mRNA cleavage and polyadenylation specificity factor complex subunit (Pta1), putative n=1 Tax=Talaromyces stipitatus (strain ATCC 10500 / CBS 375.48 / QM 6759 / NRRL 1006) TaxID=441959 RepID=B8MDZ1_TALSN|nr:mRNA cleavage and polyadenylation specificity factor complex subunit (Pta1), putative [Talaromyces stipitatus ATCC 10500]EED16068.1 mRNA cleavage and polyadenylation specificity factor complex subunit (Pta1), putative [Talaromyces stipitatus ATCC 10500]